MEPAEGMHSWNSGKWGESAKDQEVCSHWPRRHCTGEKQKNLPQFIVRHGSSRPTEESAKLSKVTVRGVLAAQTAIPWYCVNATCPEISSSSLVYPRNRRKWEELAVVVEIRYELGTAFFQDGMIERWCKDQAKNQEDFGGGRIW